MRVSERRSGAIRWLRPVVAALAGILLLLPLGGCAGGRSPSVVLVTLEGVRASDVDDPEAGPARGFLPSARALGRRGMAATTAITPSPDSAAAAASLMTGLPVAGHGVTDGPSGRVASSVPLLAERLKMAGYKTAAWIGSRSIGWQTGLSRGFEQFDEAISDSSVAVFDPTGVQSRGWDPTGRRRDPVEVVQDALRWLRGTDGPVFIWLHLAAVPETRPATRSGPWSREETAASLAGVGDALDLMLQGLQDLDRERSTVVALVGTTGYGRGDHGEWTSGLDLFDTTLRVPYVIAGPGVEPERITGPLSTSRLVSDLSKITGLPGEGAPEASVPDASGPDEAVVSVTWVPLASFGWTPAAALRTTDWALLGYPQPELYDMRADATQAANLADSDGAPLAELVSRLDATGALRSEGTGAAGAPGLPLSMADRRRVVSLLLDAGEAAGAGEMKTAESLLTEALAISPDSPALLRTRMRIRSGAGDAARRAETLEALRRAGSASPQTAIAVASTMLETGAVEDAVGVLESALETSVAASRVRIALAEALSREQAWDRAGDVLKELAGAEPTDPRLQERLGDIYLAVGYGYRAAAAYDDAAALGFRPSRLLMKLGDCHLQLKDADGALKLYREVAERDPGLASAHVRAGDALLALDRADEALQEYRLSLPRTTAGFEQGMQMADRVAAQGRDVIAFDLYQELAGLDRTRFEPHYRIGELLMNRGRLDEAQKAFDYALELSPDNGLIHYQLARIALARKDEAVALEQVERMIATGPKTIVIQAGADPLFTALAADSPVRKALASAQSAGAGTTALSPPPGPAAPASAPTVSP